MNTAVRSDRQEDKLQPYLQEKLDKSQIGMEKVTMREIKCPFCNFCVDIVGSDVTSGHKLVYCRKCKRRYIISYAHFRRQARFGRTYYRPHKRQSR